MQCFRIQIIKDIKKLANVENILLKIISRKQCFFYVFADSVNGNELPNTHNNNFKITRLK